MTHTQFIKSLGAPLKTINAWGSVRDVDGAVFLLLWQHQESHGDRFVQITSEQQYQGDVRAGAKERLRHIGLIREGATCFIIMCKAKDSNIRPHTVEFCVDDRVFVGGEIIERDGELWIYRGQPIPAREVAIPVEK